MYWYLYIVSLVNVYYLLLLEQFVTWPIFLILFFISVYQLKEEQIYHDFIVKNAVINFCCASTIGVWHVYSEQQFLTSGAVAMIMLIVLNTGSEIKVRKRFKERQKKSKK